ncbi:gamma-mobile-trio recombinase GmtY [Rheinheimera mangrovi]|jgi:hypothetical protein|uniref:gamma-mobile-trio recombinase GmtY n=1 Tax=Rheinheimera mangrovi TaxID=2498451 RepID=UPI000F8DB935|nr:gamma-mobile-trio recombinase GmtY [Rheinheimera mangrovi]
MEYVIKRRVRYRAYDSSKPLIVHAIFTHSGLLLSHLRFLERNRYKSPSWHERSAFAVELLLRFIQTQQNHAVSATELLRSFVNCLCFGTIETDGTDQTALYWLARRVDDSNTLLGHINAYCDYLDEVNGQDLPKLNPWRKATTAEEKMLWCAYYRRSANCFLNYLYQPDKEQMRRVRSVHSLANPLIQIESVFRFPEEVFGKLLKYGFQHQDGSADYGSILILLLMHFGGLRLSECFQIFTHDISINLSTQASTVKVFHPSAGASPDPLFGNRRQYLITKYRMQPRNDYHRTHTLYSGWKNPLLTNKDYSFTVLFFPETAAQLFTQYLQLYLNNLPEINHPYLISNSSGRPDTKRNFIKKYQVALSRIGLKIAKHDGLSPHGHRHSYGYRLAEAGFSQIEIQKAMHHKSPESCLVYIKPTESEVRDKIRRIRC